MKKNTENFIEENNALEGILWPIKKRFKILCDLYNQYRLLTPYKQKPFIKSFDSFKDYYAWKEKQKNPWYW
mgnify:FL=1|jgi:hypothetical protein